MPSVLIPRSQKSGLQLLSQIAPVVGSFVPGIGSAIGGAVGAVGGIASEGEEQAKDTLAQSSENINTQKAAIDVPQNQQQGAANRRLEKIQQDPYQDLTKARMILEDMPEDIKKYYKEPLESALKIAKKQRAMQSQEEFA